MGANVYLDSVASYGYNTESAATAIVQGIQPQSGKRIAIRAFGLTAGTTATDVYFMQSLGQSTLSSAVASGATTGFALAAEPVASNTLASSDYVGIMVDDGTCHFSKVATGTVSAFSLSTALDDSAAAGNVVYFFGKYSDEGHLRWNVAASTQDTADVDGGLFYANAKGKPMFVFHRNNVAGSAGSIDFITVNYINK